MLARSQPDREFEHVVRVVRQHDGPIRVPEVSAQDHSRRQDRVVRAEYAIDADVPGGALRDAEVAGEIFEFNLLLRGTAADEAPEVEHDFAGDRVFRKGFENHGFASF